MAEELDAFLGLVSDAVQRLLHVFVCGQVLHEHSASVDGGFVLDFIQHLCEGFRLEALLFKEPPAVRVARHGDHRFDGVLQHANRQLLVVEERQDGLADI